MMKNYAFNVKIICSIKDYAFWEFHSCCSSIFESRGVDPYWLVILEFSLFLSSTCECVDAFAFPVAIDEASNVGVATVILEGALSVCLAVSPLSIVDFTIFPLVHTMTVRLAIFKLSFEYIAIRKYNSS